MDKLYHEIEHGMLAKDLHKVAQGLEDLLTLAQLFDVSDLKAYGDAAFEKDSMNDRYLMLEKLLVLMARLGDSKQDSERLRKLGEKIEEFVIDLLYKDLPHPPSCYLSPLVNDPTRPPAKTPGPVNYAFRTSDGSGYNPLVPSIGRAGTPYARSVPSTKCPPPSSLPDPGLVFDTLLKRDKYVEHPGGVSSLFFAFADLVIHSIFNTNPKDATINNASSYLDLSILYGSSDEDVERVRRGDGTGRLWDDVFADNRLRLMPPSSCALLILLCRNHNYIAEKIFNINERRKYQKPSELDKKQCKAQDDEIFHRSRLVNSAYFVQIILGDYVGAILGQVRDGQDWRLNPLLEMRQGNHEWSPRGEGNTVSIEFNLLYRWHATLSQQDEKWTEEMFRRYLQEEDLSKVTPEQFHEAAVKAFSQSSKNAEDLRTRTFGGLERVNGRFRDDDLAKLMMDSTDAPAGAFKARGVPEALRVIEMIGIEHARQWGACSLNEFRKFMGLKAYKTFEEWNRDKTIASAARSLYKHIDNLEFYVGIQAEESKDPGPGAGLCPGYTISRAILADAVCLTRGDRFLTVDFTPYNLTTWGYEDCQFNTNDGSYGGMLTKLLLRTLPDQYKPKSAYAHFPFLVPSFMEQNLKERDSRNGTDEVSKYTWIRPSTPSSSPKGIQTYEVVQQILESTNDFASASDERLETILGRAPPELSFIQKELVDSREKWAIHFVALADELISKRSLKHVGSNMRNLDVVKDVLNVLPVRWICQHIVGLPIAREGGHGRYTEDQYCRKLQDICEYLFVNLDASKDWELRESARATYKKINEEVTKDFAAFSSWLKDKVNSIADYDPEDRSREFLKQLYVKRGVTDSQTIAAAIFCEVAPTAAHFSQSLAQAVNYYLDDKQKQAREDISRLSKLRTPESTEKILKYIYEALAFDPPIPVTCLTALKDVKIEDRRINAGEQVCLSICRTEPANMEHFKLGFGMHGLTLPELFEAIAPRIVGTVLSLPGIRRAPGEAGQFNKYTEEYRGIPLRQYITYEGQTSPFPDSLTIQYTRV